MFASGGYSYGREAECSGGVFKCLACGVLHGGGGLGRFIVPEGEEPGFEALAEVIIEREGGDDALGGIADAEGVAFFLRSEGADA